MFSFHAFINAGNSTKQVPLAFVLMSARRTADYTAVIQGILAVLPSQAAVQKVVLDFEAAAWQAFRATLPHVRIQGCLFHYTQAVYRKMQSIGLTQAYITDVGTHTVCREMMALPLLPHEHIVAAFDLLAARVTATTPMLLELVAYMRSTWITGAVFTPRDWCVYRQVVRTNNDVEGWHYRLNHRGKRGQLPFYMLVDLLSKEAQLVSMTVQLVFREENLRVQRPGAKATNARLQDLWSEYAAGDRSWNSLLVAGSRLICPQANAVE